MNENNPQTANRPSSDSNAGPKASDCPRFDQKFPHLYEETVQFLEKPPAERIAEIYADRYVLHPSAREVLAAMKEIYNRPQGAIRPACLAVIGDSNEGKTATARRFFRDLGGDSAHIFGNHDYMPVVLVEMPPRATEPRICLAIARALGLTGYTTSKARLVTDNVYRALIAKKVRVVILIEFQHVHPLPRCERQVVLDLIKGISNHGISIVAIGTETAREDLAEDEQVANRMRVVQLKGFRDDQVFCNFLQSLEPCYPFPKPSFLGCKELAKEIYRRTNGITGEVVMLCNAAAVWAVKNNRECIDKEAIRKALIYPAADAAA